MQTGNVNAIINSIKNSTESSKRKVSSADEKCFKDVLKTAREDSKPLITDTAVKNSDNKEAIKAENSNLKEATMSQNEGSKMLKETTVNENKDLKNLTETQDLTPQDRKDISALLEMLVQLDGNPDTKLELQKALENNDSQSVQQIILGLMQSLVGSKELKLEELINSSEATSQDLLKLNDNSVATDVLKDLAEKLSANIFSDDSLKDEIINKLNNIKSFNLDLNNSVLKEAIINKLTQLNNKEKETDNKIDDYEKQDVFMAKNEDDNKSEAEIVDSLQTKVKESKPVQITDTKEDKLLKNMLGEKKNSNKDVLDDKIAHVVTRFENIRLDKLTETVTDKPVITRNNFNMDFIKAVKFMDINNLKELSVKILPRDLGEIVIKLTMDNGVMKASITAQNKETYNLLNSQLTSISTQLSEQNMAIQSFSLSLGNGESFMSNNSGSQGKESGQQNRQASKIIGIEEDNSSEGYNLEESTFNILA